MGKKFRMPRTRQEFEQAMLKAFGDGIVNGYIVDHEQKSDDERVLCRRYLALIRGQIEDMDEPWNQEETTLEKG